MLALVPPPPPQAVISIRVAIRRYARVEVFALRAFCALRALDALRAFRELRALDALKAFCALKAFDALKAFMQSGLGSR